MRRPCEIEKMIKWLCTRSFGLVSWPAQVLGSVSNGKIVDECYAKQIWSTERSAALLPEGGHNTNVGQNPGHK